MAISYLGSPALWSGSRSTGLWAAFATSAHFPRGTYFFLPAGASPSALTLAKSMNAVIGSCVHQRLIGSSAPLAGPVVERKKEAWMNCIGGVEGV